MSATFTPGDVLLFKSDGSCIADLICRLSESEVSHAAMYYDKDKRLLIEEALEGLRVAPAPDFPGEGPLREVLVRRHRDAGLDMSEVIRKAAQHLEDKQPYGVANLIVVGCLLLFGNFARVKLLIEALEIICEQLINKINKRLHPGKTPMTCAQFVTQCYAEAGDKYRLRFERKNLHEGSLATLITESLREAKHRELPALAELLPKDDGEATPEPNAHDNKITPEDVLEALCYRILKALNSQAAHDVSDAADSEPVPPELAALGGHFARLALHDGTGAVRMDSTIQARHVIALLDKLRTVFVSPGDLQKRCVSLREVKIEGFTA